MKKHHLIEFIDIDEVERHVLRCESSFKSSSDTEFLYIVIGDMYYQYFLVSFLTFVHNSDISLHKINILTDKKTFNDHKITFQCLIRLNINIVKTEDLGVKVFENTGRVCKFDPVIKGTYSGNLFILDCDTFISSWMSFSFLENFDDRDFVFTDFSRGIKGFPHELSSRYGWSLQEGCDLEWNDYLRHIYDYVKTDNLSYDEFLTKIFSPEQPWKNCGAGYISGEIIKDRKFNDLCRWMREVLHCSSDELVYFIYSNFYGKTMDYLHSGIGVGVSCEEIVDAPVIYHFYDGPKPLLLQECLGALRSIDPKSQFLQIKGYDTVDEYFDCKSRLFNSFHVKSIDNHYIAKNIGFYSTGRNGEVNMRCKISKHDDDDDGYYMDFYFVESDESISVFMFGNDIDRAIFEYNPVLSSDGNTLDYVVIKVMSIDSKEYYSHRIIDAHIGV